MAVIDIFADLNGEQNQNSVPRKAASSAGVRDIFAEDLNQFGNVESTLSSTESLVLPQEAEPEGFWDERVQELGIATEELGALGNRFGAWARRNAGSGAIMLADNAELDPLGVGIAASQGLTGLAAYLTERAAGVRNPVPLNVEQTMDFARDQFTAAADQDRRAQEVLDRSIARTDSELGKQLIETAGDVAGSGSSFLSVFGGPAAAAVYGDVYLQEYGQSRMAGLDEEQAHINAAIQAGIEGGLSVIPSGRIVSKIPGVGSALKKFEDQLLERGDTVLGQVARVATEATTGALGEGAQEGATFVLQDGARRLQGLVGDEAARQYALEQVVKTEDYKSELWRNVRAGMAMGGAISAPISAYNTTQTAEAIRSNNADLNETAALEAAREASRRGLAGNATPVVPSTAEVPQNTTTTTAPQQPATEPVQAAPVTAPAPAPAPAPQAAEAGSAVDDPAVRNSDLGKIHYLKRQLELDEDTYRQHLVDLTGKNSAKELTPEERIRVIEDMSGKPYEAPKLKAPKAKTPKAEPAAAPAVIPDAKPGSVQADLNDMAKSLGILDQAPTSKAPALSKEGLKDYRTKLRKISESLARGGTQQDRDVSKLVRQGKLIIVPNPEVVGRTTEGMASYDSATGEMFLFTDRIDPDDDIRVETLAAAMHESAHAGQFTPREARSSILKYMLSDTKYQAVNDKIKQAAKAGNKIAQEAVADAMVAAGADPDTLVPGQEYDAVLEGLEIVPYLGTQVTRARGKPLGRIAGAWSDVQAGLRSFARQHFGANTEFDFNELMSATQKMAGEAVQTDTLRTGTQSSGQVLDMIGSRQATGFSSAEERGRVYQGYVDQQPRFEFSDSLSAITKDTDVLDLLEAGVPMQLGNVLGHQNLYEQYPDATQINVVYSPGMDPGEASFDATTNTIELGPFDRKNDRRLRSTLLHEVQHWIQEKENLIKGFNDDVLVDPSVKASKLSTDTKIKNLLDKFDTDTHVASLPEDLRAYWDELNLDDENSTPAIRAEIFLSDVFANGHPNGNVRNRARRYAQLNAERSQADAAYKEQLDAAWDAYIRDYGETEARNTQRRANVTQEQMDSALDPNPEGEMRYANFNVPVERTQNSMKLLDQKNPVAKKSSNPADNFEVKRASTFVEENYRPEVVSWAKNVWGELAAPNGRPIWQNFVEWFGDSVIVNEDGTPRVMYHGTKASVDFEEFLSDYDFEIGTHVGTAAQASDPRFVGSIYWEDGANIQANLRSAPSSRVLPLFVKMNNPLRVEDNFGMSAGVVLDGIRTALEDEEGITARDRARVEAMHQAFYDHHDRLYQAGQNTDIATNEMWPKIRQLLEDLGYDGLVYRNSAEGFRRPGSALNDPSRQNYYPDALDRPEDSYVLLNPEQAKSANNTGNFERRQRRLLDQRARRTQTVYHGTPNTFTNKSEDAPFGAFDLSFMSSGEGQQAVGYGFYFSGNWGVSDGSYRKFLIDRNDTSGPSRLESRVDQILFMTDSEGAPPPQEALDKLHEDMQTLRQQALDDLRKAREAFTSIDTQIETARETVPEIDPEQFRTMRRAHIRQDFWAAKDDLSKATDIMDIIDNSTPEQIYEVWKKSFESLSDDGELFYVEIPADEELPDWHGEFDEQPDAVRSAWAKIAGVGRLSGLYRDFYHSLSNRVGGSANASKLLAEHGIVGHKFKPIFGSGKNQPYYNYVIYDPTYAKIIGRDAREKDQTRASMVEWANEIAQKNEEKMRQWERDARDLFNQNSGENYGRMLAMATRRSKGRKQNPLPIWLRSLFSSSGATSSEIRAIREHAVSSPSSVRMLMENYEGQYRDAVSREAAKRRITEAELDALITDAIDGISTKSDNYDVNRKLFVDAASKFGDAGKVLVAMRDVVDGISLDLIADRAARAKRGEVMSEAEKKTYKTIMANLGRYGHRQFAAHVRNSDFGKTVWDSYQKALNNKTLTPAEKDNAKRVVKALNVIVDQIMIPDDAALDKASQKKIDQLYDTWKGRQNLDALSYDDKRAELAAMRDVINGDKDALRSQAERIASEILGLHGTDTGLVSEYYRGGKVNLGIIQKRKAIPPAIRELMGEIKDPAMRLFVTASKQADFVARNQMFLELTRIKDPYHVQPPGPSGRASVRGMEQLEGPAYGAMEGYYVSPELAGLVRDNIEQLATMEAAVAMAVAQPQKLATKTLMWAFDKWAGLAANAKMMQIVAKPINFLFNFFGGPRMLLMNGNINPKHFGNAFRTAAEVIAYASDPSKAGDRARRVTSIGITDSAFVGEVNSEQYRTLFRQLQKMVGTEPTLGKFRDAVRKMGLTFKETYAMMDVMFKIANFYQMADGVLPAFYKAEGIKRTQAEIDREAADIVNRTNITYKRAAGFVKALERGGITQFGTYFYEVFRTEVENFAQGIAELARANQATTPEGRRIMTIQATRRVSGQLAAWGATAMISKALAELTFGDDDEDKFLRYLLPEFMRGKDHVVVGKDADGRDVMMELSRLDPAGPASDILRKMLNHEASPKAIAEEIFGLYVAPRIGTRLLMAGEASTTGQLNVPDPILQQVFPEAFENVLRAGTLVGIEEDTTKAWTRVAEARYLPGAFDGLRKTNPKIVDADATPNAIATLSRWMGMSFSVLEPEKQIQFASMDYDAVIKDERRKMAGLARNYETITANDVLRKMVEAQSNELNAFKDVQNVYKGMQALGMSEQEISNMLKSAKVSKELRSQIYSGNFKSQAVSKKSFDNHKQSAIRRASTKAEKDAVEKKWNDAWEIISGVVDD